MTDLSGPAAAGFLGAADPSRDGQRLLDDDRAGMGYVMNLSHLWAHQPALHDGLGALLGQAVEAGGLTFRQRGILVAACASALGDSYCSLAWGTRLAGEAGDEVAAAVIRGDDDGLDDTERALARWARRLAGDAAATTADDVQALRDAGFDDDRIVAVTVFVALRIAFSTVNGGLGAGPDRELGAAAPPAVRAAVTYGRPVDGEGGSKP